MFSALVETVDDNNCSHEKLKVSTKSVDEKKPQGNTRFTDHVKKSGNLTLSF